MDVVIKNIECLRNDIDGHTKTPPERVVVDFSKVGTDEFAQLFFDACEDIKMSDLCSKCKNYSNGEKTVNCKFYITPEFSCYEEATEHEKYDEVDESYLQGVCRTCKYDSLNEFEEPCNSCIASDEISPKWERKEPTLKEVTSRMQSEFDATGKDVAYFMNHRVKPGGINND